MLSLNDYNKNNNKNRKNSWNNQFQNILKKSSRQTNGSKKNEVRYKKKSLRDNSLHKGKDELYFLSNANLNIINILNTCISEDFYNDSSFINNNNKDKIKESNINKWKKPTWKTEKGKELDQKKNRLKTNIYSNRSQLGSDFIINKKKNTFFTSIESDSLNRSKKSNLKKSINEKEIMSEGKISKNKKKKKYDKYLSNLGSESSNLKSYNKKLGINYKRMTSKSIKKLDNYNIDNLLSLDSSKNNISSSSDNRRTSIFGELNEKQIYKINENINKEVNYLQLKNKISKLKKKIESKYSNKNLKTKNELKYSNKNLKTKNENIIVLNPLSDTSINNESIDINNKRVENTYKSNLIINTDTKENLTSNRKQDNEQYRYMERKLCLYDSIDDEEYNDELIDYYISPDSLYIILFDIIMIISSMFYFVIVPYFLSTNFTLLKNNKLCRIIFISIDIIYIIDIINNFFRAYQTYDEHLIRRTRKIIKHYIKTWFFLDLIQAIPYFSIFLFLGNDIKENNNVYNEINAMCYILLILKVIKVYKMLNNNSTVTHIAEILTKNETIDDHGGMILSILLIIFVLNLTTCLFIFTGFNSYPNWIFKLNIQDDSYINIYLTAVYFIIVTITTVGYGDITGDSMPEIIFQILLLIIGTIAYSFTISYISNYIIKSHKKSMTYEKNLEILREIRLHHPNMKNDLYQEVLRSLHNEQLYERKDKHLLFDCLPYSLKNELIMEMYKPLIQNFIFFKEVYNSDFIIKVATSLKSLISIKGDILINEGDFVKEVIFVKNGVIGLNICLDLDNPENSIKKYLGKNEIGKFDISYAQLSILNQRRNTRSLLDHNLEAFLINKTEDSDDSYIESDNNCENIEDIKILEIRNNEHFGDALMFLNERCPLICKVRTRNAELLILRKMEAIEIYSVYPNIWKRINKKSLYNMEQIYLKIKRVVIDFSIRYNINFGKKRLSKFNTNNRLLFKKKKKKVTFLEVNKKNKFMKKESKISNKNNKEENKNKKEDKKAHKKEHKTETKIKKYTNKIINFSDDMTFKKSNSNEKDSKINSNISKISNNILDDNEEKKNTKNNNTTISIVKNNSFKIIKNSEKNIEIYNNNNLEINKKNSLSIQCRSFTIKNDSKESIKTNESYESKNLDDSKDSLGIKNKMTKKSSIPKREDIFYNAFINLNSTKENSLQFDSSYENINKISNDKYITDHLLQFKTKQFIIKVCTENDNNEDNNKSKLYHSPTHNQDHKFINNHLADKINVEDEFKHNNTLNKKFMNRKSSTFGKLEKPLNRRGSVALNSPNKLDKRISPFGSLRNSIRIRYSNIYSPNKIRRKLTKKKLIKVNKKLNTITKNIENTNNAINNPNEFYMNFFNNIIKKNSIINIVDEPKKEKEKKESKSSLYSLK